MGNKQWGHGRFVGYENGYEDGLKAQMDVSDEPEFYYKDCEGNADGIRKSIRIINRLRHRKKDFFCICECYDSTLTVEGFDIWYNNGSVKLFNDNDIGEWAFFHVEFCPICDRWLDPLQNYKRETETNDFRKI